VSDHLVVVEAAGRPCALRVDRACELRPVPAADLAEQGQVARLAEGLLPVHEAGRLLALAGEGRP
jgi:hypothetical protein